MANQERLASQGEIRPFVNKPPEVINSYSQALAAPGMSRLLEAEASDMYRSSLARLGLPERDVEAKAAEFTSEPMNLIKVEAAYASRQAADRLERRRIASAALRS